MGDDSRFRPVSFDDLPMPSSVRRMIGRILEGKPGLVAVTGQPGTGKTTVLLAVALDAMAAGEAVSVVVDEEENDIVEWPEEWSVHVSDGSEESWARAMDAAVSEPGLIVAPSLMMTEPNVHAAASAACAGKRVLVCVDSPLVGIDIAYYLHGWGLSDEQILDGLRGVVSSILVPRLCKECGEKALASLEDSRLICPDTDERIELWREKGCSACGGKGLKNRWAAFEALHVDDAVRPVLEDYLTRNVLRSPPPETIVRMTDCAREGVKEGAIGLETYRRVVLQHPLLRGHHLLEEEQRRSSRIKGMFSRFVASEVVERIATGDDMEKIVGGEERKVTCMFCDIRGFTPRLERTSPAESFRLLNRYFAELIDVVFLHEGTIDKFIGDSIMVIFGAPVEQEDQELRAVRCAIDMLEAIARINELGGDGLHMGIGINTGPVAAGCIGSDRRMDYTVLGDTVNEADRLEGQARPGEILVGPETAEAVRDEVQCHSVGQLDLKGRGQFMEVYSIDWR